MHGNIQIFPPRVSTGTTEDLISLPVHNLNSKDLTLGKAIQKRNRHFISTSFFSFFITPTEVGSLILRQETTIIDAARMSDGWSKNKPSPLYYTSWSRWLAGTSCHINLNHSGVPIQDSENKYWQPWLHHSSRKDRSTHRCYHFYHSSYHCFSSLKTMAS